MQERCPFCQTVLHPDSLYCHRCGLPLTETPRAPLTTWGRGRWGPIIVGLAVASTLIGWIACLIDVESIVVTGWFIAGTALVLIGIGSRMNSWTVLLLGVAQFGLCMLVLGLIVALSWSPGQAQGPVSLIGTAYVLFSAYFYYQAWACVRRSKHIPEWVCRQCGYLLVGLTESRCPECGTPFQRTGALDAPREATISNSSP